VEAGAVESLLGHYVTGGYRECRQYVGMVADGPDTELCAYG
jgi:hypothetical protein